MKNLKKKLSAAALSALLLSMQSVSVNASPIDTGLGNGNGGAVINGVMVALQVLMVKELEMSI